MFHVFVPAIAGQEPRASVARHAAASRPRDGAARRRRARRPAAGPSVARTAGYTVLEAKADARRSRWPMYQGPIDVLVTDVVMPEINGREVSERLLARRPDLKVLFMSGYNDDAVVRHGVVGSPAALLQKPFDSRTLATRVRDVLGGQPARRITGGQPAPGVLGQARAGAGAGPEGGHWRHAAFWMAAVVIVRPGVRVRRTPEGSGSPVRGSRATCKARWMPAAVWESRLKSISQGFRVSLGNWRAPATGSAATLSPRTRCAQDERGIEAGPSGVGSPVQAT